MVNIITKYNPVYPSLDKKAFDFTENIPSNYLGKNNLEIFASSIFFQTDRNFNDYGEKAELKIPFTVSQSEVDALKVSNIKKGGFGPLFSGFFLVTALGVFLSIRFWDTKKQKSKFDLELSTQFHEHIVDHVHAMLKTRLFWLIGIAVFASCLLTSTSSTLRYIPQLWLFLVGTLAFMLTLRSRALTVLVSIIALAGFANTYFTIQKNFEFQHNLTNKTQIKLAEYKSKLKNQKLELNFGHHTATRRMLDDNGINYTAIYWKDALSCKSGIIKKWSVLPENETEGCFVKNEVGKDSTK